MLEGPADCRRPHRFREGLRFIFELKKGPKAFRPITRVLK